MPYYILISEPPAFHRLTDEKKGNWGTEKARRVWSRNKK